MTANNFRKWEAPNTNKVAGTRHRYGFFVGRNFHTLTRTRVSVTASEFRFWYICTLSDYRLLSVRLHVYSLCISSNRYYGSISDLSALVLGAILGTLPTREKTRAKPVGIPLPRNDQSCKSEVDQKLRLLLNTGHSVEVGLRSCHFHLVQVGSMAY